MSTCTRFEDTYPAEYYDIHRHCTVHRDFGSAVRMLVFDIDPTSSRPETPRWRRSPRFNPRTGVLDVPVDLGGKPGVASVGDWDGNLACTPVPFAFSRSLVGLCDETVVEALEAGPDPRACETRPVECWAARIPRRVRTAVARFSGVQLLLMRCLRREPRLEEIIRSNPALVLCAAFHFQTTAAPRSGAAGLVEILMKPRREICAFALGMDSNATVKLLSRIRPDSCDQAAVSRIRNALYYRDSVHALRRVSVPTPEVLDAAARSPALVGMACLRRTPQADTGDPREASRRCGEIVRMGRDILATARQLDLPRAVITARMRTCPTVKALRRLHDRLVGELHRRGIEESLRRYEVIHGKRPFPEPPLPGTERIRPITTYRDLCAEGRRMHHCAQSHLDLILSGRFYVYAVHGPQRATVEIYNTGRGWIISELSLRCNARPSEGTRQSVRRWLDACNHAG